MHSVTKRDLVDRIVAKTKQKRTVVREVTQEVLNSITEELIKGHRIELRDFGVFEPVFRPGKTAQNPKTLDPVYVKPKYSIRFKPGRLMKDEVANGAWAQSQLNQRHQVVEPTAPVVNQQEVEEEPPIIHTMSQPSPAPQQS